MHGGSDAKLLQQVEDAVAAMPRKQREIFLSFTLDHASCAQIAGRTGLSVREVERQLTRAIAKLSKQMEGYPLSWWERWF